MLAWNVITSYQTGSGWLTVDNSSGTGNATVRVAADTTGLAAGTYQATVTVNAGSAGSQTIPVTLTVSAAPPPPPAPIPSVPTPTISQVVNAATFGVTALVPGSLATVMGAHLAGKSVSVTFDGALATILYAGDSQINLRVPALGTKTTANVVATADGTSSAPVTIALAPAWPAVFPHGVLNQDNRENAADAPAHAGEVLQVFTTGIPQDATVSAQIGGQKNLVPLYAGEAPAVPGVQQVNVAIPEGVGAGAPLVLCATPTGGRQYCSEPFPLSVQ